jgi:hypothetical protein
MYCIFVAGAQRTDNRYPIIGRTATIPRMLKRMNKPRGRCARHQRRVAGPCSALQDRGCPLNDTPPERPSPLMLATALGLVPIMRLLLHEGAHRDHASYGELTLSQQTRLGRLRTPLPKTRRYWSRPFRFCCGNPLCTETEFRRQCTFYTCSHCHTQRYCSPQCSQAHWPEHFATMQRSDTAVDGR